MSPRASLLDRALIDYQLDKAIDTDDVTNIPVVVSTWEGAVAFANARAALTNHAQHIERVRDVTVGQARLTTAHLVSPR